jgi:outer membrane receptor protein involved in Fe transport
MKVSLAHDDMDQFEGHGDTKNKLFGSIRVQSRPAQGHELDLTAGTSRQKFDVLFPETSLLDPATYTTRATEHYIQGKYILDECLTLRLSWTRFIADGQPDAVFIPFSIVLDTADVDLQYSFTPWRSQNVTLGTGLRYSTFNTDDQDISNGRHSTRVEWFFVQDEITLAPDLFLTAGIRLDEHSTAGLSIAPRLALIFELEPPKTIEVDGKATLSPGQSLRATAGYGYRNPGLRELWFNMQVPTKITNPLPPPPTLQATVIGNPDLEPEMMRSFEIGYWGRPTSSLQAECSIFYNLSDHLVVFDSVPPPAGVTTPIAIQRQNRNREDAYGIEANVEYQLTKQVFVFGNYAYQLRHNRITHNRIPDGPLNKANAGVRYQEDAGLSGMVWVNFFDEITFTDKTTGNHVGHVSAYGLLNAKVWYPVKVGSADGKVFVQAFNATNHVHREHPNGDEYGVIAMAGMELAW